MINLLGRLVSPHEPLLWVLRSRLSESGGRGVVTAPKTWRPRFVVIISPSTCPRQVPAPVSTEPGLEESLKEQGVANPFGKPRTSISRQLSAEGREVSEQCG